MVTNKDINAVTDKLKCCGKVVCEKLPDCVRFWEKRPRVAVIRLAGVIADQTMHRKGISYEAVAGNIDKAFGKAGIQAVALVINSPGGAPAQTSLIGSHIRRLAGEKKIPVYAFIEDIAASGGYWLACSADEIYAQEGSIVGSVGVISASFGFEDFIKRYDIHRRVYTAGKDKSFLDPFVPVRKSDEERLKALQTDIHKSFITWVRQRRGEKIEAPDRDVFEGQFWTAGPALEKGLIDGIGDLRSFMNEKFGDNVKLIFCSPDTRKSLLRFFVGGQAGESLPDEILETLENRTFWSRYGL